MQASINQPLPIGHQLHDYEIRNVLSAGGFSFVYIARDAEQKTVAIKEYLPTSLALRTEGAHIEISPEALGNFRHGLKCFFEEGRALANIDHKNIVRVLNFFRANDTVYMVMHYERGKSLQDYILSQSEPVSENFVRRRLPGIAGFWLGTTNPFRSPAQIATQLYSGLCFTRAVFQSRRPRPMERHIQHRCHHVCLPGTCSPHGRRPAHEE